MAENNLSEKELGETLKNVRRSYRLLYEYQRRVMDLVRYIGNNYGYHKDPTGWYWFSDQAPRDSKQVNLKSWAWDWLGMYLFDFHFGDKKVGRETVTFSVVLQSDTGHPDAVKNGKTIFGTDVDKFESPENAKTRLIFWAATKGWNELWDKNEADELAKDRWEIKDNNSNQLAIAYNLEEFINQTTADTIMDDFAEECRLVGIPIGEVE